MPKSQSKKSNSAAKQKAIRDFLVNHGHAKAKVDALNVSDSDKTRDVVLALHGLSREDLRRGSVG